MSKSLHRLLPGFLLLAVTATAQITVIWNQNFDNPGSPWDVTGGLVIDTGSGGATISAPTLENTDVAPGAGNLYSAIFANNGFEYLTTFAGLDPNTTGYGIEMWVKSATGSVNIASFGAPDSNGIALALSAGSYFGKVAGVGNFGSGVAQAGAGSINGWDHIAVVADGTTATFYVNGVLQGSYAGGISSPDNVWHMFVNPGGSVKYDGMADELKFFTFASGTFSTNSLDYALAAIPEPSAGAALLGAIGLVGAWYRRQRR